MAESVLKWQVITDAKALRALGSMWQQLAEQCHCQFVFNSPEWILTWLDTYWQPQWQLRCLAGFEGEQLVAFLPLYIQPCQNPFELSRAFPLGAGEPEKAEIASEYVDCLVHSNYKDDAILKFQSFIDELSVDSVEWRAALNEQLICQVIKHNPRVSNVGRYIVNTELWEQSQLTKNSQKKIARLTNKLNNAKAKFAWVEPENHDVVWDKLASFHQARWQKKGHLGAFISSDFHKFHKAYREQAQSIKMSCLLIDEEVIAIHYYFSSNDTLYFYQSGWLDSEFSAFSPSYMLHLWSIKHCEEKFYDFMMANKSESYKQQFLGQLEPMQNLHIIKSKKKAFVVKIINKLLHKIATSK